MTFKRRRCARSGLRGKPPRILLLRSPPPPLQALQRLDTRLDTLLDRSWTPSWTSEWTPSGHRPEIGTEAGRMSWRFKSVAVSAVAPAPCLWGDRLISGGCRPRAGRGVGVDEPPGTASQFMLISWRAPCRFAKRQQIGKSLRPFFEVKLCAWEARGLCVETGTPRVCAGRRVTPYIAGNLAFSDTARRFSGYARDWTDRPAQLQIRRQELLGAFAPGGVTRPVRKAEEASSPALVR